MKKSTIYNIIVILILLLGAAFVVLQFCHFGRVEYTDNARVCRYIAPQNTRVQGFIKEIRFDAFADSNHQFADARDACLYR